jgi:hypothetical protein
LTLTTPDLYSPTTREEIMPSSSHRLRASAVVFAMLGWCGTASADVTGHWYTTRGMRYLLQTGDDVTTGYGQYTYEGTFVGNSIDLVADVAWDERYSLTLSPDESTLSGTYHSFGCYFSICQVVNQSVTFTRCECYDGNGANGDGCDLQCRSEEGCLSCSGDPATCTPAADGTPCEDRSSCIAGGVCQAGVCEGGTVDAACLDFTGGWLRTEYSFTEDRSSSAAWEAVQEAGEIELYERPSTLVGQTAVVDAEARTILIDGAVTGSPFCSGSYYPDPNPIGEDGRSFSAWGQYVSQGGPGRCVSFESFGEVGVRCADFGLESTDGCRVDSCQRCGGTPEICESVPDGTPCVPDDPVSVVSTCNGGACVASIADPCPVCMTRVGVNGCEYLPRENCRGPIDARDTKLILKDGDSGDRLKWSWKDGGRISAYELGRTDLYSEVALCIFTESEATVFAGIVNEGIGTFDVADVGSELGWTSQSDGSVRYKERTGRSDGITQVRIETGAAGDNSILVKGGGLSLSVPRAELPLPLRVQLQIEGGACFEGRFGAEGVSKNADGSFRAKGTP